MKRLAFKSDVEKITDKADKMMQAIFVSKAHSFLTGECIQELNIKASKAEIHFSRKCGTPRPYSP